ncbi:MAG: lipid A deacylase LpxR family protein [Pseudomonadota bacterium]
MFVRVVGAALGLLTWGVGGLPAKAEEHPGAVYGFLFENDWAGGRDENYTAGWQWTRATKRQSEGPVDRYLQLALGQQMYTPQNQNESDPVFDQHPYAGWLFGEALFVTDRGAGKPIDAIGVQIGVVGPWALAEEAQDTAHRLVDESTFQGWDNQIGNQPGLQIHLQRRWTSMRWGQGKWQADLQPSISANLGNVYLSAEVGGVIRYGKNLDRPLGEHRHQPGSTGITWFSDQPASARTAYAFFGAQARAVGYAIWLDGRPFQEDTVTQASEDFVYDLEGGLSMPLGLGDSRITLSYMRRSRTFEEQVDAQGIGRLSLVTRF